MKQGLARNESGHFTADSDRRTMGVHVRDNKSQSKDSTRALEGKSSCSRAVCSTAAPHLEVVFSMRCMRIFVLYSLASLNVERT